MCMAGYVVIYILELNIIFDILRQACRGIFLADHLQVSMRTGLPLVEPLFKSTVCCSGDFTVSVLLFTTHTALHSTHAFICCSFKN